MVPVAHPGAGELKLDGPEGGEDVGGWTTDSVENSLEVSADAGLYRRGQATAAIRRAQS
jgi:hypothetical protein